MHRIVDRIIQYCISEDLVTQEDVPWFRYGLERRISSIIVGIPFLILAVVISGFFSASSFFITYFIIRKYLGGYHAKTVWGCLFCSLLMELLFLGVLSHFLFTSVLFVVLILCTLAILFLAPYNHPNLHLTAEEKKICRQKCILRFCVVLLADMFFFIIGMREIANGCTIGIAMATALLCMGYINDWRNISHGKEPN